MPHCNRNCGCHGHLARASATALVLAVGLIQMGSLFAQAPVKLPIPDAAARKTAAKDIKELYGQQLAKAKIAAKKIELAKKLLQVGIDSKNDPNSRYVLLRISKDIAAGAGDADTAFQAIDQMDKFYKIDAFKLKSDTLIKAAKHVKTKAATKIIVERASLLIDDSAEKDKYDLAEKLGEISLAAARKVRDYKSAKQIVERNKEIKAIAQEYEKVKSAFATLETKPTDSTANMEVGKFYSLAKGDWQKGLAMLALGSDATLKSLAVKELQGPKPADFLVLGHGWWQQAAKEKGLAQKQLQAHAAIWYRKALPSLTGIGKVKVERRLEQVPKIASIVASSSKTGPSSKKLTAKQGTPNGFIGDYLVLWNQHNSNPKDRGSRICNIKLLLGGKVIWNKNNVTLDWSPSQDKANRIKLPKLGFDRIRIEITAWYGNGGGLAEVEVFKGKKNIAHSSRVSASGFFTRTRGFDPEKVIDGIKSSAKHGIGYWLLPDKQPGWIELSFESGSPPSDSSEQWISKNATYKLSSIFGSFVPLPSLLNESQQFYMKDQFAFHTKQQQGAWVTIDLGKPSRITRVFIQNRHAIDQHRAAGMSLYISSDGRRQQKVWTTTQGLPEWNVRLKSPIIGRYVTLKLPDNVNKQLHLKKVKIFGFETTSSFKAKTVRSLKVTKPVPTPKRPGMTLIGTKWSWNNNGWIMFHGNNRLSTEWGNGSWRTLDELRVVAIFGGNKLPHVLTFSPDGKSFQSLKQDGARASGKLLSQ